MIRPAHGLAAALALVAACSSVPTAPTFAGITLPTLFSAAAPGENGLPTGWNIYRLFRFKPLTQYELVKEGGTQVVHARANNSASGLTQPVSVDLLATPVAEWSWKVPKLIASADNT